jgi:murein L,D-transpeptidase YcbB/YkuD
MRRTSLIPLTLLGIACAQGCGASPPAPEVARHITTVRESSRPGGEPLAERTAVSRFYKARDSRPAWLDHADEIVAAIRGTEADGLNPSDYHLDAIQSLLEKRRSNGTAENDAILDVLLADAVAGMADDVHYGRIRPSQVNPAWTADPRDGASPLDSTLAVIAKSSSVKAAVDAQRPNHFIYRGLVGALERLRKVDAQGGWPTVPTGKNLRPGVIDPRVAAVRRRLLAGGDADGNIPRDSTRYDATLASAVQRFQARHRIDSTGVIDRATIEAMNVSAKARLAQVRVNLERARWVLAGLGEDFMLVNLPAFKAYLIRGNHNVWESRTQIGQEAMQTPTFRAKIQTVVFNPDWSVPQSILENEILKDMRSGKNVIERQGLVIYDRSNNVVDPASIDWSSATPATFPYTIRQPASDDNALGKVKFLFPNKYSIYLHDTPNRRLFEADRRTFSHGCIRLEQPIELAQLLLRDQDHWDASKIAQVIASGATQNVALEHSLPILIVYWTVSVGASGEVRYAQDIYHLDPPLLAAMDRSSRP